MIFSFTIKVLSSWILSQHSYVKKYLSVSTNHWWISFEKVSVFKCLPIYFVSLSFYFKSPIYSNFVSILSFATLSNKFLSVCDLHVFTEKRDSDLCTLLGKTSVNILSIQMKIKLQWLILIFKMVWWYQACICNNILHCRDFYIPIRWHGCLRHW